MILFFYECSHSEYAPALPSELGFLILIYISEFHIHYVVSRRSQLYGTMPSLPFRELTLATYQRHSVRSLRDKKRQKALLYPEGIKHFLPQSNRHRIEPATQRLSSKHYSHYATASNWSIPIFKIQLLYIPILLPDQEYS